MRKYNDAYDSDYLNEAARETISKWGSVDEYTKAMIHKYGADCWNNKEVVFEEEILPIWVTFPYAEPCDLGWRMGSGESYICIYSEYLESLSKEEYLKYREKYPIPQYIYGFALGCVPEEYLTEEEIEYRDGEWEDDMMLNYTTRSYFMEELKSKNLLMLRNMLDEGADAHPNISESFIERLIKIIEGLDEQPEITINENGSVTFEFNNPWVELNLKLIFSDGDQYIYEKIYGERGECEREDDILVRCVKNKVHDFFE